MQFEKRCQRGFVHDARRHRQHHIGEFVWLKIRLPIVHQQERDRRVGTHSLVAVDKGVVLANVKQLGRSHDGYGRVKIFATEAGLWSRKRRLQPSRITNTG